MKLIILLAVLAWSNGDKLDKTYLPPSHAQTSGGSSNFLQTPVSGSSQDFQNDFQGSNNYADNFAQNDGSFAQNGNDFAQNGNVYAQAGNGFSQDSNNYAQNGNGFPGNQFGQNVNFEARPERAQAAFERNAAILRLDNQNDGEVYAYAYETENGIIAEENGVATNGVEAQGGYSYTGDDGQVYSIRYTADQNGFQPTGDHLPTPPPIPEEILKALEQNARDEANGIFDDGSYDEAKYGDAETSQFNNNYENGQSNNNYGNGQSNNNYENGYNYNNGNGNNFNAGADFSNQGFGSNEDDAVVTNNALIRSNDGSAQGFNNQNTQAGFGTQNSQASFGNQNTLATFGNRNTQASFGNQNTQAIIGPQNTQAAFGQNNQFSQNGVEKAYLPPGNGQRGQARYQNNGFRNQNGVEKAYLPPNQFGQRASQSNGQYNKRNGVRNGGNGVEKAYVPPFGQSLAQNGQSQSPSRFSQPQNFRAHGPRQPVGSASREYLPPTATQRNNGRGRRPSFNARNGYRY